MRDVGDVGGGVGFLGIEGVGMFLGVDAEVREENEGCGAFDAAGGVEAAEEVVGFLFEGFGDTEAVGVFGVGGVAGDGVVAGGR